MLIYLRFVNSPIILAKKKILPQEFVSNSPLAFPSISLDLTISFTCSSRTEWAEIAPASETSSFSLYDFSASDLKF